MRSRLKRGQYVRGMATLYTQDHQPIPKGSVGTVQDICLHPWSSGHRRVHGIFVVRVLFPNGFVARVNDRALVRMRPGPDKYSPFEDDE